MDRMTDEEFRKHVELTMAMSTDFLTGRLTRETYASNLKALTRKMGADACTCDVCQGFGRQRREAEKPLETV